MLPFQYGLKFNLFINDFSSIIYIPQLILFINDCSFSFNLIFFSAEVSFEKKVYIFFLSEVFCRLSSVSSFFSTLGLFFFSFHFFLWSHYFPFALWFRFQNSVWKYPFIDSFDKPISKFSIYIYYEKLKMTDFK